MSDKFRVNVLIATPAAILMLIIYTFMGQGVVAPTHAATVNLVKVIPYLMVIVLAITGMNVMAVLVVGSLACGLIGMIDGSYDFFGWLIAMGKGISGMGELIMVAMMAGGMLEIIRENGGIDFIINKFTSHVRTKRGAEFATAALVSLVNVCTANNTIAILTIGDIASVSTTERMPASSTPSPAPSKGCSPMVCKCSWLRVWQVAVQC